MSSFYGSYSYSLPSGGWTNDFSASRSAWDAQGYDMDPVKGLSKKSAATPVSAPAQKSYSVDSSGQKTFYGLGKDELLDIADPWRSQRGQYQTALSDLIKNPDQFANSNLFKSATNAGIEAVNRNAASRGLLKSGNRLQALMDYGQQQAPQTFFKMADLLTQLSGGRNQAPGAGLGAMTNLSNAATNQFQAETGRLAQQAGANQFDINRQDQQNQQRQQQQSLDQLMQWQQKQQQQQQNAQNVQNSFNAMDDYWARQDQLDRDYFNQYGSQRPSYL